MKGLSRPYTFKLVNGRDGIKPDSPFPTFSFLLILTPIPPLGYFWTKSFCRALKLKDKQAEPLWFSFDALFVHSLSHWKLGLIIEKERIGIICKGTD